MSDFDSIRHHIQAHQLQRSVKLAEALAAVIIATINGLNLARQKVADTLAGKPRALN